MAFALLGLGLVIASLADNVPAVQALGQCIFLPMLIIGGVAVQLATLPEWAQHLSAFFPGRYAVEAMQASVTGAGLAAVKFALLALALIGAAGFLAGVRMFRWDAQQRFATRGGKGWIAVALAAWAAVGLLAEARGRIATGGATGMAETAALPAPRVAVAPPAAAGPAPAPAPAPANPGAATPEATATAPGATAPRAPEPGAAAASRTPDPGAAAAAPPAAAAGSPNATGKPADSAAPSSPPAAAPPRDPGSAAPTPSPAAPEAAQPASPAPAPHAPAPPAPRTGPPPEPASWRDVTPAHIDEVMFERLPSDMGVISPIAPADEVLDPDLATELETVRASLPGWAPGRVADPVQRVRNILYVAAVPDAFQLPLERYLPHVVFERLRDEVPKDDLIKILFWIATHPAGGDDSAVDQLRAAGLDVSGPADIDQARERVMLYALKLLGRLVNRIPG